MRACWGDFGRGRELPGEHLRSVKYAAQLRLGTLPLPGLLSGYWANEVANRQDADPIHFVSSVFIAGAGRCEASGKDKALQERALSFLARRIARLASVRSIPADFPSPPLIVVVISLGDIWRFAIFRWGHQSMRCRCGFSSRRAMRCSGRSSRSVS